MHVDARAEAKRLVSLLHAEHGVTQGVFGALGFDGERLGEGGGGVEARDVAAHILGAHALQHDCRCAGGDTWLEALGQSRRGAARLSGGQARFAPRARQKAPGYRLSRRARKLGDLRRRVAHLRRRSANGRLHWRR